MRKNFEEKILLVQRLLYFSYLLVNEQQHVSDRVSERECMDTATSASESIRFIIILH
jgi:hypothetical protein